VLRISPYHLQYHHPVRPEVEERVPLTDGEEGAEVAMTNGLVTEISHHFPHSPMEMSFMTVEAHSIAAITKETDAV